MQKLIKALIVCTLAVEITLVMWLVFKCPEEISISIGKFDSKDAGLRASIPKLADEILKCPGAAKYYIIWIGPETDPAVSSVGRRSTFYNRAAKVIGYEVDAYSGSYGRTYRADDEVIRSVAEKGGTLEDFAEYDRTIR
jgi:hypothetical protein